AECLAAGDLRARREGQPGGEVFVTRPAAHVEAGLRDDFAGGGRVDAVDAGEIDAREAIEVGADIEGGGRAVQLGRARLGGERVARGLVGEAAEGPLDLAIAGHALLLVEVEEFHRLPQREEVLRAPRSLQRAGNGLLVLLAAAVPEPSEDTRIPLAVEDRAEDAPARHPGDVTDDPGEFD